MWARIFIILFVVAIWLLWLLFDLAIWIPLASTAAMVFGALAYWLAKRIRAHRAADQLERAIAQQARADQSSMRPDRADEIKEMSDEFRNAVRALKSSKLGGGGRSALYALPWYLIVGPPGSGKSTAIRNSGLKFPYLSSHCKNGAVRGVGGTRNCDWWLCNEAVLLDTAGRWTTQEDEQEWFAFLDLLKRHRKRSPLNGLIVAVSIDDVANEDDDAPSKLARQVRERIDEAIQRLGVVPPIYVVFTKCDLIAGFVETFENLNSSERVQVWGFTSPGEKTPDSIREYFSRKFTELRGALRRRTLKRMSEERRIEDRSAVFHFSEQLGVVEQPLRRFVEELFAPSVFHDSPWLRGVYFTSGTQEGKPLDRMLKQLSDRLGVPLPATTNKQTAEPRSYFLQSMFSDIVFRDASDATPSHNRAKGYRFARVVASGALVVSAIATSVCTASAWFENHSLLNASLDASREALLPSEGEVHDEEAFARGASQRLEPLRKTLRELEAHRADHPPLSMRFGMYRGGDLHQPLLNAYISQVESAIVGVVYADTERQLQDFGRRYRSRPDEIPNLNEYSRHYRLLKLYLLLTKQRREKPELNAARQRWLKRAVARQWIHGEMCETTSPDCSMTAIAPHLELYVQNLSSGAVVEGSRPFPRDRAIVQAARNALVRVPQTQLVLSEIIEQVAPLDYDQTIDRLVGDASGALQSKRRIRGAFTRRAWENHVRKYLSDPRKREHEQQWVLLAKASVRHASLSESRAKELHDAYFAAYVEEWKSFLHSVRTRPTSNNTETLQLIQDLTRGEPTVLGRLFRATHHNTVLHRKRGLEQFGEAVSSLADRIRDGINDKLSDKDGEASKEETAAPQERKLATTRISRALRGFTRFGVSDDGGAQGGGDSTTGLAIYQEQLIFLRDALQSFRDDPTDSEALSTRVEEARTRVKGLIALQPTGWKPLFEALLWEPIEQASSGSARAVGAENQQTWCSSVWSPYDSTLRNRYPFVAGQPDAALADFEAFYRPESGHLWAFYHASLEKQIPHDGRRFRFAKGFGTQTDRVYSPAARAFLEHAWMLSQALFSEGSEAQVQMDVRIRPTPGIASIALSVGGVTVAHRNGPERWTRVQWPGEEAERGASITVRGAQGTREQIKQRGAWGLFRLVEQGRVAPLPDRRSFRIAWPVHVSRSPIVLDVRPVRGKGPFTVRARGDQALMRLFRTQKPPRSLTHAAGRCGSREIR